MLTCSILVGCPEGGVMLPDAGGDRVRFELRKTFGNRISYWSQRRGGVLSSFINGCEQLRERIRKSFDAFIFQFLSHNSH